jgi:hypothetical protein
MAYKLQLKRGASGSLPTGIAGEPLFTTDTNDLYIGTGASNQRYQKYIASGSSSQFLKGDGSLDSNTYYLASNPSAFIALTALTASSPLSYNNTTGAFTIAQASGSVNGFLSSTDWTTFNNKQNTITNPVTGTGTTNYLPKWTSGSAIGNSQIFDNGTNVGVGSATPVSIGTGITTLDIQGSSSGGIAFGPSGTKNYIYGAGTLFIEANTTAVFTTGGTERMRLTSTGLGIGTTSISGKLDVFSSSDVYQNISTSGNNTSAVLNLYNSSGVTDGAAIGYNVAMRFGTITGLNAAGFSEKMRLNASGNLGLGVVPSAWTAGGQNIEVGSAGNIIQGQASQIAVIQNATFNLGWKYSANGFASFVLQTSGQHQWFTAPSGTAGNAISFTQAMTLSAGGDLGIANTSPSYRVDIEGSSGSISTVRVKNGAIGASDGSQILLGNSANFTNAYFRLNGGGNSSQGGAGSLNIGLTESAAMTFLTANTERLRITSGGNLLLGTTTDNNKFDLQVANKTSITTTGSAINVNYDGSTNNQYQTIGFSWGASIGNRNSYWGMGFTGTNYSSGTGDLFLFTNATERLRITSGGNLLVGTTSDGGQKLQVNGTGLFTDILTLRTGTNGYNGEITLGSNAANRGRIYYDGDINGQLIFQNTYDSTNTNSGILFQTRTAGTAVNALKISGSGIINLANVPSSATGLSSGDIYKDASGFLKIV